MELITWRPKTADEVEILPEESASQPTLETDVESNPCGCSSPLDNADVSESGQAANDNGTISPVIQTTNGSLVPSSRPRTDVRPRGKDTMSNAEHKVERK